MQVFNCIYDYLLLFFGLFNIYNVMKIIEINTKLILKNYFISFLILIVLYFFILAVDYIFTVEMYPFWKWAIISAILSLYFPYRLIRIKRWQNRKKQ